MDFLKRKYIVLLLIIITLAAFFRLWQLDSIPPALWPDEAINANTAVQILETKNFELFYPDNHGREGFFFLLVSFSFALFGISLYSFKLVPAFFGILTIVGQYLFSLEFFRTIKFEEKRAQISALLASFFLAISFWHINFSRIGFRAILVPFILTFSFYFLLRGLRTRHFLNFVFSGIFFGLGFHTYISFRLAVFLLGFILFFWFFIVLKEKWLKKYIFASFLLLVLTGMVALPIGLYFLENPDHFVSRAMGVSVFEQESPIFSFFKSFLSHLLMFNFYGDANWRHNLSGAPQLFFLAGLFSLVGFFWIVRQLIFLFKNKQDSRLIKIASFLFLFSWCFFLLLPSALTIEGIPHALRTIGVIPVAYLFSGLGAYLVWNRIKNNWGKEKARNLFALLLTVMVFSSFTAYFFVWAKHPHLEQAFTKRFSDLGYELNNFPLETKKYVIKNEGDLPTEVPRFIQKTAGRDEAIYLEPWQAEMIEFDPGDFIFIMNKEINSLYSLMNRFPDGLLIEKERILIYEIK